MTFVQAVRTCLSNYATFSGRAARPEYWWFMLFIFGVSLILGGLDSLIFSADPVTGEQPTPISGLFSLAIFLPSLAATVRRLHDTGRSGWYAALPFAITAAFLITVFGGIALVGGNTLPPTDPNRDTLYGIAAVVVLVMAIAQLVVALLLLWWCIKPSQPVQNIYGPPPLN